MTDTAEPDLPLTRAARHLPRGLFKYRSELEFNTCEDDTCVTGTITATYDLYSESPKDWIGPDFLLSGQPWHSVLSLHRDDDDGQEPCRCSCPLKGHEGVVDHRWWGRSGRFCRRSFRSARTSRRSARTSRSSWRTSLRSCFTSFRSLRMSCLSCWSVPDVAPARRS